MNSPSVAVLVHGTFPLRSLLSRVPRNAAWMHEGAELPNALRAAFGDRLTIERFKWSGANSFVARDRAASDLAARLDELALEHESANIFVIAHSHGGNVATYALARCSHPHAVSALVTLATPFVHLEPRALRFSATLFSGTLALLGIIAAASVFFHRVANPAIDYAHDHTTGIWRWIAVLTVALILGNWSKGIIVIVRSIVTGFESFFLNLLESVQEEVVPRTSTLPYAPVPVLCVAMQGDEARGLLTLVRAVKAPFDLVALGGFGVLVTTVVALLIVWCLDLAAGPLGLGLAVLGKVSLFARFVVLDKVLLVLFVIVIAACFVCAAGVLLSFLASLVIAGHPFGEGTNHVLAPLIVRSRMKLTPFFEGNVQLRRHSVRALWGKSVVSMLRPELVHSWSHSLPAVVADVVRWLEEQPQFGAVAPAVVRTVSPPQTSAAGWVLRVGSLVPALAVAVIGVAAVTSWLMGAAMRFTAAGDPCEYADNLPFARCADRTTALMCSREGKVIGVPCRGSGGCGRAPEAGPDDDHLECDESIGWEGEPCVGDESTCSADQSATLRCESGRWRVFQSCLGPRHCKVERVENRELLLACDTSLGLIGGACAAGNACSVDRQALLECIEGKWKVKSDCLGPTRCEADGRRLSCDESLGRPGGACSISLGCSADGRNELECNDGKWETAADCDGPKGCAVSEHQISCDQSLAKPEGRCTRGSSCSIDGRAELTCENGQFIEILKCRGKKGCYLSGDDVLCDQPTGGVGGFCTDGSFACSGDGRAILACQNKHFRTARDCEHGTRCSANDTLPERTTFLCGASFTAISQDLYR